MTVVVPHNSSQQAVMLVLENTSDSLLGAGIKNLVVVDQRKSWNGPVMSFSLTGKLGYISVPLSGTLAVDETNVTLECEPPPIAKNVLGEERFRSMMEANLRTVLS